MQYFGLKGNNGGNSVYPDSNIFSNNSIFQHDSNSNEDKKLVKSKRRVADHAEVFTPSWLVSDMLDLVQHETERIDSRFLEPACGSGNFLKQILVRKLKVVQQKYGKSEFEKLHYSLLSLMCIYGIELLKDNVKECKENLLYEFINFLRLEKNNIFAKAAESVLDSNIIQADALTLTTDKGASIVFPEWGYLGNGKFQRRDFKYESLTQRSGIAGTLLEILEENDVFIPTKSYPQMTVEEIAK